jgi:hypothetical protein
MFAIPWFGRNMPAEPMEGDSALGPAMCGDWRTASNLME